MLSGSPATGNRNSRGTESVVEVIEKLEPTIGLEPMTCRLRTADEAERVRTEPTSDELTARDSGGPEEVNHPAGSS